MLNLNLPNVCRASEGMSEYNKVAEAHMHFGQHAKSCEIDWLSPKQYFVNVKRECTEVSNAK